MEKVICSEVLGMFWGQVKISFSYFAMENLANNLWTKLMEINFNSTLNNYSGLSEKQLTTRTTEGQPQPYGTMHLHTNPKNSVAYDSY